MDIPYTAKIRIGGKFDIPQLNKYLLDTSSWDAFTEHIKTPYFMVANELLDTKTFDFEFESFK